MNNRDQSKTQEVPITTTTSSHRSITPPRRFLDFTTQSRRTIQGPSRLASSSPPRLTSSAAALSPEVLEEQTTPSTSSASTLPSTPPAEQNATPPPPPTLSPLPRLTRIPKIVLTPVDTEELFQKNKNSGSPENTILPPPPTLIKMPISTRKEKRATVIAKSSQETVTEQNEKSNGKAKEPPRKRARIGERVSESSTSTTTETVPPTTPRKIIQEIFGPDKSKKSKGRKRKRGGGGAISPKKVKGQSDIDTLKDSEPNDSSEVNDQFEIEEKCSQNQAEEDEEEDDQPESQEVEENTEEGREVKEEEQEDDDDTESISSSSVRRVSKRKAKQVANEKLKRMGLNQSEGVDADNKSVKDEPAGIRSRRSTTDGSSKSSNGTNQDDVESNSGGGRSYVNRHLAIDRQRSNATPLSVMSEDADDDDGKTEGVDGDALSVGDSQEHRDSDVDSTYSWKPVRAAAAIALEQVTKKQGSIAGSTGVSADAEAKAAQVAERRARKVMRYKGRNRRTLLFKSSSSKKLISARHNRSSAQPTILPKVFHHGYYFQAGDVIYIEVEGESTPQYGQVTGILLDHVGEASASVRWLSAKSVLYDFVDFSPTNYEIRYDLPERLINIEYVNFVMHLNLDFFQGHHSFNKIERFSIYSRLGKSINPFPNEFDKESTTNPEQSSTSQSDNEVDNSKSKDDDDDDNEEDGNSSVTSVENLSVDEENVCDDKFEDGDADEKPYIPEEIGAEQSEDFKAESTEVDGEVNIESELVEEKENNENEIVTEENIKHETENVVQEMIQEIVEVEETQESENAAAESEKLESVPAEEEVANINADLQIA